MQRDIDALQHSKFDIVVIGAGIHGACIARDATLRGFKVLLIDKGDINQATSHNSLKTIHGGIRYLQHLNFKRTLESIKEQHIWLKTAPHLTRPLPFLMPTYGHGARGPLFMGLGIFLYEMLGWYRNKGLHKDKRHKRGYLLNKTNCLKQAANTKQDNLTGAAVWSDAQMIYADQAALELAQFTATNGGQVCNYIQAVDFEFNAENQVSGVVVKDMLNQHDNHFVIQTDMVINAAGPWLADLLNSSSHDFKQTLALTKSMNVVLRYPALDCAIAMVSKQHNDAKVGKTKRLYFMVPWLGKSIIGTTHFAYDGDIENLPYDKQEMEIFIEEINEAYPGINLTLDDVLYCYQGLTPANDDTNNQHATRAHHSKIVDHSENGYHGIISVLSVKWTTARLMAKKALDIVCDKVNKNLSCKTDKTDVPDAFSAYIGFAECDNDQLKQRCQFHIDKTLCVNLTDLLLRRTNDLVLNKLSEPQIRLACDVMRDHFKWSDKDFENQIDMLLNTGIGDAQRQKIQTARQNILDKQ